MSHPPFVFRMPAHLCARTGSAVRRGGLRQGPSPFSRPRRPRLRANGGWGQGTELEGFPLRPQLPFITKGARAYVASFHPTPVAPADVRRYAVTEPHGQGLPPPPLPPRIMIQRIHQCALGRQQQQLRRTPNSCPGQAVRFCVPKERRGGKV